MKRLRPFFIYFGAKWKLAPLYPAPQHNIIIEPFAGSACYSLLHWDKQIILVDKADYIVMIWSYLIRVSEKEILSLPNVYPGQHLDEFKIPEEAKQLIGFWIGNGASPRYQMSYSFYNKHKFTEGVWGLKVKRRIAQQLKYIRHWQVFHGDYSIAPDIEATWFVDPPYQQRGGHHYPSSNKNINYAQLGDWCRSRKGQVIVCEANGANWLPFQTFRAGYRSSIQSITRGENTTYTELIWTNSMDMGRSEN